MVGSKLYQVFSLLPQFLDSPKKVCCGKNKELRNFINFICLVYTFAQGKKGG
jgi:hypothetical protein